MADVNVSRPANKKHQLARINLKYACAILLRRMQIGKDLKK